MKNDRKRRKTKARVDGPHRRELIKSAREFIYDMARPVDSDKVENLLKGESYVPTDVSSLTLTIPNFDDFRFRTHFLIDSNFFLPLTCLTCLLWILCMKWRLECGSLYSYI